MLANRVREFSTTVGTGDVTLDGALAGHVRFADAFASGDQVIYVIEDGDNYEIGIGTLNTPTILARTTVSETLQDGMLTKTDASAIPLSGSARIYCAVSADYLLDPRKSADVITEVTPEAGVTIDGVQLKDAGGIFTGGLIVGGSAVFETDVTLSGVSAADAKKLAFHDGQAAYLTYQTGTSTEAVLGGYQGLVFKNIQNDRDDLKLEASGKAVFGAGADFAGPVQLVNLTVTGAGTQTVFDSGAAASGRVEFKRDGVREGFLGWDTGSLTLSADGGSLQFDDQSVFAGDVIIGGDLKFAGSATVIDTTTLNTGDNIIVLNANVTGTPTENAGVEIERGSESNATILWNESKDSFEFSHGVEVPGDVSFGAAAAFTGPLTANGRLTAGDELTDFQFELSNTPNQSYYLRNMDTSGNFAIHRNSVGDILSYSQATHNWDFQGTSLVEIADLNVNGAASIGGNVTVADANPKIFVDAIASGDPAVHFRMDGVDKGYVWLNRADESLNLGKPGVNPIVTLKSDMSTTLHGDVNVGGRVGFGGGFELHANGCNHSFATGVISLSGGSSIGLGANMLLYGEGHSTNAYDVLFRASSDPWLHYDHSASIVDFNGNALNGIGKVKQAELTVEAASGARQVQIVPAVTALNAFIRNAYTGAGMTFQNNPLGDGSTFVNLLSLDDTGADFHNLAVSNVGTLDAGAASFSGDVSVGGTLQLSNNSLVSVSNIIRGTGSDRLTLTGGGSSTLGSGLILYGQSHATRAKDVEFQADGVGVLNFDYSASFWNFQGHDLKGIEKLTVDGGAKISVQGKVDGGNGQGIFFWDTDDTDWGMYMGSAGGTRSLTGTAATAPLDGRTQQHIRYRVASGTEFGFLWENAAEQCLMSLTADTGKLYTRGAINSGANVISDTNFRGGMGAAHVPTHSFSDYVDMGAYVHSPNVYAVAVGGAAQLTISETELNLQANALKGVSKLTVDGGDVSSGGNAGSLTVHGGDSNGGGITLFGSSHSTRAFDIEFHTGGSPKGWWDHSAAHWNWDSRDFANVGKLTVDGGAKVSVQNKVDGGSEQGIFLWHTDTTHYGIYMASAGPSKSLADETACVSLDGRGAPHIRFRGINSSGSGFLWENSSEECLMSLTADTGDLYTKGDVNVGDDIFASGEVAATSNSQNFNVGPARTVIDFVSGSNLARIGHVNGAGGTPADLQILSGGGARLSYKHATAAWDFHSNTLLGNQYIGRYFTRGIATSDIVISAGSDVARGSSITMYGEGHATNANDVVIRKGAASTTTILNWDDSSAHWNFRDNNLVQVGDISMFGNDIHRNVSNDLLHVSGGTAFNLGANIQLYGENHATRPNDIEFYDSAVLVGKYHATNGTWNYQDNDVLTTGRITAGQIEASGVLSSQAGSVRPNPASLPPGARFFDTAVDKPVYVNAAQNGWIEGTGDNSGGSSTPGTVDGNSLTVGANVDVPVVIQGKSDRASSGAGLVALRANWNNTPVAQVNLLSGSDATSKDNGQIAFDVAADSGTLQEAMRLNSDRSASFTGDVSINKDMARLNVNATSGNPATHYQVNGSDAAYTWWDTANSKLRFGVAGYNPVLSLDDAGLAEFSGELTAANITSNGGLRNSQGGITTVLAADGSGSYLESQGANDLRFLVGGANRMRLTAAGTIACDATLDVTGPIVARHTGTQVRLFDSNNTIDVNDYGYMEYNNGATVFGDYDASSSGWNTFLSLSKDNATVHCNFDIKNTPDPVLSLQGDQLGGEHYNELAMWNQPGTKMFSIRQAYITAAPHIYYNSLSTGDHVFQFQGTDVFRTGAGATTVSGAFNIDLGSGQGTHFGLGNDKENYITRGDAGATRFRNQSASLTDLTLSSTGADFHNNNVYGVNKLTVDGGAKISVQNRQDTGLDLGIRWWDSDENAWVSYMATAGVLSPQNVSTTSSLDGRTGHHLRARAAAHHTTGYIWENNLEQCLMSLTADSGDLYTKGDMHVGGAIKDAAVIRRTVESESTLLSGGASVNSGASIVCHGAAHASNANDMFFRADTTYTLLYDHSAGVWDFQDKTITTTGGISASDVAANGTIASGAGATRPDPATLAVGARFYDTSIDKPVYVNAAKDGWVEGGAVTGGVTVVSAVQSPYSASAGQRIAVDSSSGPVNILWDVTGLAAGEHIDVSSSHGDVSANALTVTLTGGSLSVGGVTDTVLNITNNNITASLTVMSPGVVGVA